MFKLIVVFALATLALGAPKLNKKHHFPSGRIVGGDDASIEDYPYQLSLLLRGKTHICGAVIVDEKWVVTSAFCTNWYKASDLKIRASSDLLEKGGQVVDVKSIHGHPQYSLWGVDYDISVLELVEPLKLDQTAAPIKLVPTQYEPKEGAEATITGWGTLNEDDYYFPEQLQVVKVPIVNRDSCNKDYGGIVTENMICAGLKTGGKDFCQRDIGGPMVIDGKLAGIVSWHVGCAQTDFPGVYSNIGTLGDFVRNVTGLDL